MPRRFFTSIRSSLMLLVVLAVLPALGIIIFTGVEQQRHRMADLEEDALRQIETLSEIQERITLSAKQTLTVLAGIHTGHHDHQQCSANLAAVLRSNPDFLNLTMTDAQGAVSASPNLPRGTDLSDRRHVRDALATGAFAPGEYMLAKLNSVPAFAYSYPTRSQAGLVNGTVNLTYRLDSYRRLFEILSPPQKSFLGIVDRNGRRLFFHPPKDSNPVGGMIQSRVFSNMKDGEDRGTFFARGADGSRRFYSYRKMRLNPTAEPYMYLVLAMPADEVAYTFRMGLIRNILLLALATLLSLGIAWIVGNRIFARRVDLLVCAANALSEGDLSARTGIASEPSELGAVARAMDGMAAALEVRAAEQAESERRITNSLREKEIMLKEIHHRVKNNLQLVISLISLQRREPVSMDVFAAKLDGRVRAMALVYEVLYRSEDFTSVDIPAYAEELCALIIQNGQPRGGCEFSFSAAPLRLPLDTVIPFGLILNELLTNACAHAVCDERCRVAVNIIHEDDRVRVTISDNGGGMPEQSIREGGLGIRLIRSLAAQLRGSIEWRNNDGAVAVLVFPVVQPKAELGFYHGDGISPDNDI